MGLPGFYYGQLRFPIRFIHGSGAEVPTVSEAIEQLWAKMHGQSRRTLMGLLGFYYGQPLFQSGLSMVAEQRCLPSSRSTWTVIMVVEGLAVRNWRGAASVILNNVLLVYKPSPHRPSCIAHCMLRTQKRHLEPG